MLVLDDIRQDRPLLEGIRSALPRTLPPQMIESAASGEGLAASTNIPDDPTAPPGQTEAPRGPTVKVAPAVITAPAPDTAIEMPEPESLAPIHVTIGRVEVRAIMSAPPPQPVVRPAVPEQRALSLDEYLKQRKGASR